KPCDKTTMIASRQHLMQKEVQVIQYYLFTLDSAFRREVKEFDGLVARWASKVPDHRKARFYESASRSELAVYLNQRFPGFTWQSTFVAIYSFLEDEMFRICRILSEHLGIKLDPTDLREEGIRAAKKYLEDLCGIPFPEKKHAWQETLHYNRI